MVSEKVCVETFGGGGCFLFFCCFFAVSFSSKKMGGRLSWACFFFFLFFCFFVEFGQVGVDFGDLYFWISDLSFFGRDWSA